MYKLRVTAIPANHCPGSVMFLFETLVDGSVGYRILYTGDFRFEDVELSSIRSLHQSTSEAVPRPLAFDEMYLDTTFCHPKYKSFPKRSEARGKIWEIVHGWVRKNGMYRKQARERISAYCGTF